MRVLLLMCLVVAVLGPLRRSLAEPPPVRVIVHPENPATTLDREFVADVFL